MSREIGSIYIIIYYNILLYILSMKTPHLKMLNDNVTNDNGDNVPLPHRDIRECLMTT